MRFGTREHDSQAAQPTPGEQGGTHPLITLNSTITREKWCGDYGVQQQEVPTLREKQTYATISRPFVYQLRTM